MSVNTHKTFTRKRLPLALCTLLTSTPGWVSAQDVAVTNSDGEGVVLNEIIVTGLRQSLENAALFKRNSVNITDSVFSEDVGKFPDLNIAEAINRVPGIQLSREIDGSGVNVAIRGLNTNFTKVTLNGAQIAVASSGKTDAINSNRELDLDVFPTEFFTRLDVNKTTTASMLEGGMSGTVNMRSLRPMDTTTNYLNYQAQMSYNELAEEVSPRASLLGSWKNEDRSFGILAGVSAMNNSVVTRGYESMGWTNASLTFDQCGRMPTAGAYPGTPTGNDCGGSTGGNTFVIGSPIYATPDGDPINQPGFHVVPNNTYITGKTTNTVYGPGSVIDKAFLEDVNPGLTIDQIGNALIPRLGRPHYSEGDRDRVAGIFSMEWLPNEYGNYFLDVMYAKAEREYDRLDMMMVGRNSQIIPTNMQVDSNNIVTSADFYNAQFLLEARPYTEDLEFFSISPGASFFIGDSIQLDFQVNATESTWRRESPSIGIQTTLNSGIAAHFNNVGGEFPVVIANVNLNDPNQVAGWQLERAQIQMEERTTDTLGTRLDVIFGDEANNVKVGVSYDELDRTIVGLDNSYQWLSTVSSTIGNENLKDYLSPGPDNFVRVDYDRLFDATNYESLSEEAFLVSATSTGAASGAIWEKNTALYVEGNYETYIADRQLRLNGGVRYVSTDQETGGVEMITEFVDGTEVQVGYLRTAKNDYQEVLPSFNASFELAENFLLRTALSRTMTRANPTEMLPAVLFVDPSAQYASRGNPALEPYTSDNFDIGLEWYFGDEGYTSLNYFQKTIKGFTEGRYTTHTLEQLGIEFDKLPSQQKDAIIQRGGPSVATIVLTTPQNTDGELDLQGVEFLWVQPLSFVMDGLGYSVNFTHIDQEPKGEGAPAFATQVSKNTVNATAYYENESLTLRLSYVWYDEQYGSNLGDFGIHDAQRFIDPRGQWDFSASYELSSLPTSPKITFNLINFGSDPQREVFSHDNAAYTVYDPGYTAIIGIRGVLY